MRVLDFNDTLRTLCKNKSQAVVEISTGNEGVAQISDR